jgi:glucokinase
MRSRNAPGGSLVGVDVGGTKVAVLVTDSRYNVRSKITMPTVLDSQESTIAGIAEAVREGVTRAGASMSDVTALGLGVPGRVDPQTGLVRSAVNLGWRELQVGEMLSARLGVPCLLENDARLAAVGVQRYMGSAAPQDMAYVSVGTGIAAGLILNGRNYRGSHGLAGEIGHMIIEPDGPRCRCGARGCLEALAAGPAIAAMGEEAAEANPRSLLGKERPVRAETVYQAARKGDKTARAITRRVGGYLALALQQLIVAYDVEAIVLGGGVSRNGDTFLQPILAELALLRRDSALTGEMIQPDMIRLLPPDYEAGAWGAVVLASGALADLQDSIRDGKERDAFPEQSPVTLPELKKI